MKKFIFIGFASLVIATLLTGCSKNTFQSKKNFQPRVKVEANHREMNNQEKLVVNQINPENIPILTVTTVPQEKKIIKVIKKKETLMEKMVNVFAPKKKEILAPIFHPNKKILGESKTLAGERTVGLVINLLAIACAITALLLIIGMAHGNVWVCFTIGMVFALAAIIIGFVGKMLPFRGFGLLAGVLGILAAMALLIFLLLIAVVHIVF